MSEPNDAVRDHLAYHVGQLVAVRRALGVWG